MSKNPLGSRKRPYLSDYLGGSSIAPMVMSDDKWEETKERFKLREHECPICKKIFSPQVASEWAYKDAKHLFCSWKCLRESETQKEKKKKKKRGRVDEDY